MIWLMSRKALKLGPVFSVPSALGVSGAASARTMASLRTGRTATQRGTAAGRLGPATRLDCIVRDARAILQHNAFRNQQASTSLGSKDCLYLYSFEFYQLKDWLGCLCQWINLRWMATGLPAPLLGAYLVGPPALGRFITQGNGPPIPDSSNCPHICAWYEHEHGPAWPLPRCISCYPGARPSVMGAGVAKASRGQWTSIGKRVHNYMRMRRHASSEVIYGTESAQR